MQTFRPRRQHQLFLHHLSKHGAQTGCMFSVLKATEKLVESHQKEKRPVFVKYAGAVASFVESYIAANQIYPKISEVVRGTGGNRSTIKRILDELNLDKNALGCKEVCVKGPDDMKVRHTAHSVTECMPSNNIDSKNSGWSCSDDFDQLAPEVVSMDAETDTEGIDISAENLEKKGLSGGTDPTLLKLFGRAILSNNKADANRRVAPLMEVLQQKSSGSSRRVHLSASGGIENYLSWDKSLLSIMPTSVGGNEDTTGLKAEQPKVDKESIGHASSSFEKSKHSSENASGLKYTVNLMPSKKKSILSTLSGIQLQNALKRDAGVFKDLKKTRICSSTGNTNPHAILEFKDNKSMEKALKLKTITIVGEHLSLQEGSTATVDLIMGGNTQPAGLGKTSVFQEIIQRMDGSQKKKNVSSEILPSPTHSCVEDKKSDVCMQAQPVSRASFSQIITIQGCPTNIPLTSIESFFSVFGKVQTTSASSKGTVFVEFENESDKEKALKVQQFTVDGCSFLIRPDAPSDALVVRLKHERFAVNHKEVIKACKKYGYVEKVSLRKFQTMDVQFGAEKRETIEELLESLHRDEYLKGKWKASIICSGYVKVDVFQACDKEKVENLVVSLRELVTHLTGWLGTKSGILNQLAADIECMSATKKVV